MVEAEPQALSAGLPASAGSNTSVPLAYASGGVRWERDGDVLHVFVPADRNARTAAGLSVALALVFVLPIQMWNLWVPVARVGLARAGGAALLDACEHAAWGTAVTVAVWGGAAWLIVWLFAWRTEPVVIAAGPTGIRYGSLGTERTTLLPRGQIAHITCGRLFWHRFTVLNASGRFSRWSPWRVSRQLAAGSRADLELVADEIRSALGLSVAPDRVAGGRPPMTSAAL